ncbi:gliding motility-associated C-terminal domain-containing protein [Sphingobacterium multivorum]|uniref:gliding motility-associated C-terminal domain-containing protein n=1 Tax=Sphingobacterium multivorum TaxID=28454 RepID=UPI0028AABFA6|nr:gliding motility-associated C-terminal domain-containing protein [Sphingobacterium multivorum]
MKKILIVFLLVLSLYNIGSGQGENNVWTFGNHYSLDFNYSPPLLKDTTYVNNWSYESQNVTYMYPTEHFYDRAQAVCDNTGKLLFMVKMYTYSTTSYTAPCIFDKDEMPIAGTEFLLQNNDMERSRPVIIPNPGNAQQYYIFYVRHGGLVYCLFDLTLNGDRGDIVPGKKNVLLYSYNTLIGTRMAAVQGCEGVWLVARHKTYNQYLSFKVSAMGVSATPVVSEIGAFPVGNYFGGILAVSPDGKKIATGVGRGGIYNYAGGLEMYDFEKCSGRLKNLQVIDTGAQVHGVCFSPDNTKLYAGYAIPWQNVSYYYDQFVYQFDLSLPSLSAIAASKTGILQNPIAYRIAPFCPTTTNLMGNIQLAPNGKLYLSNSHPGVCPGTGPGMALHIIHQPNNIGLASMPQINAMYNQWNGMTSDGGPCDMPYQMVLPPKIKTDTIAGAQYKFVVCFKEDTVLKAPADLSCIQWEDGSTDSLRQINANGTYLLYHVKDCTVYVDSYKVTFLPPPKVDLVQYGCPGQISLQAGEVRGEVYEYMLKNDRGLIVNAQTTDSIFITNNLDEGIYRLLISSVEGCSRRVDIELSAYPAPNVSVDPPNASISYGQSITLRAAGASYYAWSPARWLNNSSLDEVIATPEENTVFRVRGVNDYGCWDSAFVEVKIGTDNRMVLPNAFSPNGDGLNDLFRIPGAHFKIRSFEIYNRYGQMVYQDSGNNQGWDGCYNGKPCDQGVYYYYLILDFFEGTYKTFKGEINLLR